MAEGNFAFMKARDSMNTI